MKEKVIYIMGVSGSGKSLVGNLLASELSVPFIDADDHHSLSNIKKMSAGIPLNDDDRWPWLRKINQIAKESVRSGCVIACSALKEEYRMTLNNSIEKKVIWIYLKGTFEQIVERMKNRQDHFMQPSMLKSQFDTLEEPENAIIVDVSDLPEQLIQKIKSYLA